MSIATETWPIDGTCSPGFENVRTAFAENFDAGIECGASCAVWHRGVKVVDLWGGYTDEAHQQAWQRDTIVNMMSVAKGIAALCVHRLAGEGRIDLDANVTAYWPEFGQGGKEAVLVRHTLDHRAGVPIVEDPLWPGAVYDWEAMIAAIEKQPAIWPAGTQPAYHTITMSFLLGELVRRVTGGTLGEYFDTQIRGPLDLDYWLGLPAGDHARCARFLKWGGYNSKTGEADAPPDMLVKAWQQFDPAQDDGYNSTQFRNAQLPAVSGHGNARAIAKLYGALSLGGEMDGVRVIDGAALARATEMQWEDTEPVLTHNYRMGLGFTLNSPDAFMGPNAAAFGHVGAGGSTGFADPVDGIGVSYAMNKMYPSRDNGPRARRLITAVYDALGAAK